MKTRELKMKTTCLTLLLLLPISAAAQIVVNGDFEEPDISLSNTPASETFFAGSNPSFPGWYVAFGEVDSKEVGGGDQILDLNGPGEFGGAIQQSITTFNGKYALSFTWDVNDLEAENAGQNVIAAVVNWGSETIAVLNYNVDTNVRSHPQTVNLVVQGHGGSDMLQFISRNNGPAGVLLDDVTLRLGSSDPVSPPVPDPGNNPAPIPEPGHFVMIAGLGLCVFAAWRRVSRRGRVA